MSAPPKRPRDHAARSRAASDFTTNLVVSAGAGTGKTTLLVERILAAIGSGVARLPEIAAMTFTDKAAGELRQRLATGLQDMRRLAAGGTGDASTAAKSALSWLTQAARIDRVTIAGRAAESEASLDRAMITTIHGFCSEILRAYPLATGLPPGFAVDRGLFGRRFAAEEWSAFIEEELGPDGQRGALWGRLLHRFDLGGLAKLGRVLSGGAIPERALRTVPSAFDLRAALGRDAQALAREIRAAIDRTPGLTPAPREWLTDAARMLTALAAEGVSAALAILTSSPRLDREPDVRTKKVSDAEAALLESLEARARPFLKGLAAFDPQAESDLFEALLPYARRLRARQLRAGLIDFDGLLVKTRDLLRDVLPIRSSLQNRFRLILVDEFQDTDPIQYEIVFFLAERTGGDAADAYETRLEPGRLFIVGDAKQSIYRFRGADYGAYRAAVRHVLDEGGEELTLRSNFRSTPSVLEPVNALFTEPGSLVWRSSAYLPPYEPIGAEREADHACAVEVWTTTAGAGASASARRWAESLAMASELRTFAGPGLPWRYDDVLVLFRGFSDLAPYLRALREAGIPFVVSGGRTFFDRTEIIQALAVLRAVADPDDPVALLAYRRSPAGGVPDTELYADAMGFDEARPALAAANARLQELRVAANDLPVDAAVLRVLEDSGLIALSAAAFEGPQRIANLEKLQTAANELARDGKRTLLETLHALEEGFESDEEGDSPLADEERDAVRVMSIHKAKGLEARVVILADAAAGRANRPPKNQTARMARFGKEELVRLDGPVFRNGAAIAASIDDHAHRSAEDVRLLYVALTRARDRLIVFGADGGKTPWTDAISGWTVGVTHRVVGGGTRSASPDPPEDAGSTIASARFEEAVAAIAARSVSSFRSPSDPSDDAGPVRRVEGALDRTLAREVGRIVHARLAGFDPPGGGAASAAAESILRDFAGTELAKRLAALEVLGREVPMLFGESGARFSGVLDLLYRDGDGSIVIADFKTDATDDGAIERHGEQLRIYARAVAAALPGERVRAELWMLRSGRVLEV